jgi:DUF3014 family protein
MPQTPFEPTLPSVNFDDTDARPRSSHAGATGSSAKWLGAIVALAAIGAGGYWWWLKQNEAPPAPAPAPSSTEAPPAPAKAEPTIRHPIDEARANVGASPDDRDHMPALADSDAPLRAALANLPGAGDFDRLFNPQGIVRRFVATVDNLPRRSVAQQVMIAKPVPGSFVATGSDANLAISAENSARYTPYVRLMHAVDAKTLVALYVRVYPWFQQGYQELGYPNGYFNDRLIDVIDNLLATPDVPGPIALVQPHVLYEFADPNLESLSAGQKIMLRMGTNNAAQVRAKLREVRRLLTGAKAELKTSPPS